jgi:hypothetical protein
LKDVAFALRFEPGALRFGGIHETVSSKKENARKTKVAAEFYAKNLVFLNAGREQDPVGFGFTLLLLVLP